MGKHVPPHRPIVVGPAAHIQPVGDVFGSQYMRQPDISAIDAVETDQMPGTIIRLEDDEVPSFLTLKMSPHQVGITDMLFAAKLRDLYPEHLVLWGVQPASFELSLELSPPVAAQVDSLVEQIRQELQRWGVILQPNPTR